MTVRPIIIMGIAACCAAAMLSCVSETPGPSAGETVCDDGVDDEGDGETDCMDADCAGVEACRLVPEANCTDALDNDGDRLGDCADPDCNHDPACEGLEEDYCDDGLDDDQDGETDCADPDCEAAVYCESGSETFCADSVDNDGDGITDCSDAECGSATVCSGGGFSCFTLLWCYRCCPELDYACQQACNNAASAEAMGQMNALMACAEQHCSSRCYPVWDCHSCAKIHCQAEMDGCGFAPLGTGGCRQVNDCGSNCGYITSRTGDADSCPNNPAIRCWDNCYRLGDQDAFDLQRAMNYCIIENCFECYEYWEDAFCPYCAGQYCNDAFWDCDYDY